MRELRDEEVIRYAAHEHFLEHGDRVKFKEGLDAHASYDTIRGALTRYAYNRVGKDWQDAEDCVQDAYVSVLLTAKVNEFFNFSGLYKIWLDRAIRDKRIEKRRINEIIIEDVEIDGADGLTLIDLAEGDSPTPELLIEIQTKVDGIMTSSNKLKPKAKAVIRLIVIFGYSYKEVAEMLNITPKRVHNTLVYFKKVYEEKL